MTSSSNQKIIQNEKSQIRKILGLDEKIEIVLNDDGWTSRVYLIDQGKIVFKFPRNEDVKKEYECEIPAYKIAHKLCDAIMIPEVKWQHPQNNYIGYKGVVGKSLYESVTELTKNQKEQIGTKIGAFLRKLHACNLDCAKTITVDQECNDQEKRFEKGRSLYTNIFTPRELEKIKKFMYEEYRQKMTHLPYETGLCHADLGHWNIIHGKNNQVGIIDFGDIGYYDTSIDFAGMIDHDMKREALKAYGKKMSLERIELRRKMLPVLDLMYFIKDGDSSSVEKNIQSIKSTILT